MKRKERGRHVPEGTIRPTTSTRSVRAVAILPVLVGACAQEPPPGGFVEGPELVVTERGLPEELARETFFRVVGLATIEPEAGNPVVAIADAGNYRILFWWPSERRVASFGRDGSGPGEFGSIQAVWPLNDMVMVSDLSNRRLMFVSPEEGDLGTAPRDWTNLAAGGAFLPGGVFTLPADETAADPFEFRRLEWRGGRLQLEAGQRPAGFPRVDSVLRPVHPLYDEAGLLFPPEVPGSTDVVVMLGSTLVWVEQRTGAVAFVRLDEGRNPEMPGVTVIRVPERVIAEHVHHWVESRGEARMREQRFQVFWKTRPDATGRRALFPIPLSTGDPLGWLLELQADGVVEGRVVRLVDGDALPYRVRAALPLEENQYLVGHEGGLTLLEEVRP